jgi:peptidyl-prolyl cis-trans isomerase SurA
LEPTVDPDVVPAAARVDSSTDPTAVHAEGSPVKLKEAGRAAARVGDEVITLNELTAAVREKIAGLPNNYQPNRQEIMMITSQVLDMLIERSTLIQEAKRELKKPEQMKLFMKVADQAFREEELPALLRKHSVENEYKLKEKLAEQGKSLDALRESFRLDFLAKGFLHQKITPKLAVTVAEMRDYYNAHLHEYDLPEQWTWREVIVELEKHASRAEARSKAEAALARLRRGDDFAAVAQAESEGPNRGAGGLWETAPESYAVGAVNEALKSLPVGQVSGIIEGPSSYHIVRVDARRAAGPASFADVQDKIRRVIHNQKAHRESNALFDRLRKQTVVTTMFDKTAYAPAASRGSLDPSATKASASESAASRPTP